MIKIDQLSQAIAESLSEYTEEVVKMVDRSSDSIVKKSVATLKQTSPKDRGKYAKGWKKKTDKRIGQPNSHTIYNSEYRLTHLLEKGHAKVGGGRVQAQPHIRPVELEIEEQFTREVKEAIRNG